MKRLRTGDVAAALGESEYAVRALANQFVFYIPATRIGEERYFSPEAVDVFRLIFEQLAVGVRDEYIELLLGRRYPVAEVAVGGGAGWSAFHTDQAGMTMPFTGGGHDAGRASLALPEVAANHPERSTSVAQSDAERDALLQQAQAMQQRVEALEQRLRELETPMPRPVANHRPASGGASGGIVSPRRGFEDLASRDSMAGD